MGYNLRDFILKTFSPNLDRINGSADVLCEFSSNVTPGWDTDVHRLMTTPQTAGPAREHDALRLVRLFSFCSLLSLLRCSTVYGTVLLPLLRCCTVYGTVLLPLLRCSTVYGTVLLPLLRCSTVYGTVFLPLLRCSTVYGTVLLPLLRCCTVYGTVFLPLLRCSTVYGTAFGCRIRVYTLLYQNCFEFSCAQRGKYDERTNLYLRVYDWRR